MIRANCYYIRFQFDFTKYTTQKGVAELCRKLGIKALISDYDDDGTFVGLLLDIFNKQAYDVYGKTNSDDIRIIDTNTVNCFLNFLCIDFSDKEIFFLEDFNIPNFKIEDDNYCFMLRKGAST